MALERTPINGPVDGEGRKEIHLRGWVSEVREMDFTNDPELQRYVDFINDDKNKPHFADPPSTIEGLRVEARETGYHFLTAVNGLGEVVGGMLIEDAARSQHDHFLRWVVVDPELQSSKPGTGTGTGKAMLRKGIDWAATTLTHDGRRRDKLDASIIMGVDGWRIMQHILRDKLAFKRLMKLEDQVDVFDPKTGTIVRRHTERWELNLRLWRELRELDEPIEKIPQTGK